MVCLWMLLVGESLGAEYVDMDLGGADGSWLWYAGSEDYTGGGGGGAGGSIVLDGAVSGEGYVSVQGGEGATGYYEGSGGGAGGRVVIASGGGDLDVAASGAVAGTDWQPYMCYYYCGIDGETGGDGVITFDAPSPPSLHLFGSCSSTVRLAMSGLTPSSSFVLAAGTSVGVTTVPTGVCAGTDVDLTGILGVWSLASDPAGELVLEMAPPPALCGSHTQLLDLSTCATSNVELVKR